MELGDLFSDLQMLFSMVKMWSCILTLYFHFSILEQTIYLKKKGSMIWSHHTLFNSSLFQYIQRGMAGELKKKKNAGKIF